MSMPISWPLKRSSPAISRAAPSSSNRASLTLEKPLPGKQPAAGLQRGVAEQRQDEAEHAADGETDQVRALLLMTDAIEKHHRLAPLAGHGDHRQRPQADAAALAQVCAGAVDQA